MTTRRAFILAAPLPLVVGCSTVQTDNLQPGGLKKFNRVYIEPVTEDEFRVMPALIVELKDMGFQVVGRPFTEPTEADLIARVNAVGGWDMTRYLQSIQIQFTGYAPRRSAPAPG